MENMISRIETLKKEKDAVILAHYYVNDDVQKVADYIGDSYYLAKLAKTVPQSVICFCGVSFMGESAKILNPEKTVVMPDYEADCPMAHMADIDKIKAVREQYKDVAVVCYINSSAEIKQYADVCVTSSNAYKIVNALPNQYIYFIPDENLGRYLATKLTNKTFIFNDGYCHVHKNISKQSVMDTKQARPEALVLAHPECTMEVLELADYIGSTSEIIDYATSSDVKEFIICTEIGVFYELQKRNPDKKFYPASQEQVCPGMKAITLEKVAASLEEISVGVQMDVELSKKAELPLNRMLELAK